MNYTISKVPVRPDEANNFWRSIPTDELSYFLPQSSDHRPRTEVRLCHDLQGIHGLFEVEDRFVRCVRTDYGSEVWKDGCVEFFVEPKPARGYFNFEFNGGGAFLVNHIVDPTRTADGFKAFARIPEAIARPVRVRSSLPPVVEPEISEAVNLGAGILPPVHAVGKLCWPIGGSSGANMARELLQMRGGKFPSALGGVVARG